MTQKQIEMDAFENKVLSSLFGSDWRNSKEFKFIELFKPGVVQTYINKFETLVEPFMNENGTVNGYMLKQALAIKGSMFADLIPDRDFVLSNVADEVVLLIKGK